MDKLNEKTSWWQAHRPTTRRLVQLYAALLHNTYIKGFITGEIYKGQAKNVCVPGLNCYSCPGAVGACPLGSLQNALAVTGHRAGWYVLGILMLFGITLGRTICGWLCPLGLIQELLHRIPTPKIRKSKVTRVLSWLKYVILAVFAIAIPLWYGLKYDLPMPGFCKYICPAGTLEGAVGHLVHPANTSMFCMLRELFTNKWIIMILLALACTFCYRSFCRFICPLGAVYSLFNRFCIVGVKVDADRCNGCGACVRHCQMDVHHVGDRECIHCAKCMDVCHQGAISVKAGRITLKAPEIGCAGELPEAPKKRKRTPRILWCVALAVLCFALLWFNIIEPSIPQKKQDEQPVVTEPPEISEEQEEDTEAQETIAQETIRWESDLPVGFDPGQQLADFTLHCYDGTDFHLADMCGKIVFINLWSTYCTPCKKELPYFDELYRAHKDDIAMVIVHYWLVTDDPEEYLADKGYAMPFATDDEDLMTKLANANGTLPQTIVLNRKGEVIYNDRGSMTPDLLEALYAEADASVPK
ncbi:MAG: redoxin domain-containing protein [Clostridia bacterium]|nr:redoxin domain-containing protein [Clostridia bacterium]